MKHLAPGTISSCPSVSLKKIAAFLWVFLLSVHHLQAQAPDIEWEKARGGNQLDQLFALHHTSDGGSIIGGTSESDISGDKTGANKGDRDYWILKLAADGTKEWDKTFGASSEDMLFSIQQTKDGGYILGGYTFGSGGDLSQPVRGGSDYWVIKISANGNKQWDKRFGGDSFDVLRSVQQTIDGGYILGGFSSSGISGDKTEDRRGTMQTNDYWVVKITANGTKQWDRTFGGELNDQLYAIRQTIDGGYVMGGTSTSGIGGDKSETNQLPGEFEFDSDYWVVKISATGQKEWDRTLGGDGPEDLRALIVTDDGGILAGGLSEAPASGNKTEDSKGLSDYWVVKLSDTGVQQWDKTIGSATRDELHALAQHPDGSLLLGGSSESCACGDKTERSRGGFDYWVVKLAANGSRIIWDKTVGSRGADNLRAVDFTTDGGTIFGGYTNAGAGADKSQVSLGSFDYWIVKLAPDQPPLPVTLVQFSAKKEGNTALLSWSTTSETRSARFEVQHSTDGKLWNTLSSINAKGESKNTVQYRYVHANPLTDTENLYRLKMVDNDGTYTYSRMESLAFDGAEAVRIYPNPATDLVILQVEDWKNVNKVELLNSQANAIFTASKPVKTIDVRHLQPGIYFARITHRDGSMRLHKIMVAR